MSLLRAGKGGVLLAVHAQPGARRNEVAGLHGDRLRVRTNAVAEDGRANAQIALILAEAFDLARSSVTLSSGASSRRKEFLLEGLDEAAAGERLAAILAGTPG